MHVLKLRQRELAEENFPLATIRRVLKHAGFDLSKDIGRADNFFENTVTFYQLDSESTQAEQPVTSCRIDEPCTS